MPGILKDIRRTLSAKGRIRKYLAYALGEFLLVVIGILVALQINDWAENSRQRKLESVYMAELLSEIKQDTLYLNEVIHALVSGADSARRALEALEGRTTVADLVFLNQFKQSYVGGDWSINPVIWSELKSTGNLSIIRNRQVVKALATYYGRLEHSIQVSKFEVQDTYDGRMYDKRTFSGPDNVDFFYDLKLDTIHDAGVRDRLQRDPESIELMRRITVSRTIIANELQLLRDLGEAAIRSLEEEMSAEN